MRKSAEEEPAEIPLNWIRWKHVGTVERDDAGDLVFPPVAPVPGIYRFTIEDGAEDRARVVAGYIGQAKVNLARRFSLYRSRGKRPSQPLERKTTSRNARCLLDALEAGYRVNVAVVGDRVTGDDGRTIVLDLTDKLFRSNLERRLITALSRTGIKVLNRHANQGSRTST